MFITQRETIKILDEYKLKNIRPEIIKIEPGIFLGMTERKMYGLAENILAPTIVMCKNFGQLLHPLSFNRIGLLLGIDSLLRNKNIIILMQIEDIKQVDVAFRRPLRLPEILEEEEIKALLIDPTKL